MEDTVNGHSRVISHSAVALVRLTCTAKLFCRSPRECYTRHGADYRSLRCVRQNTGRAEGLGILGANRIRRSPAIMDCSIRLRRCSALQRRRLGLRKQYRATGNLSVQGLAPRSSQLSRPEIPVQPRTPKDNRGRLAHPFRISLP